MSKILKFGIDGIDVLFTFENKISNLDGDRASVKKRTYTSINMGEIISMVIELFCISF
ncbi:MAG TPA: hypothetical protein VF691_20995 [Cytophagaceae bacterium]